MPRQTRRLNKDGDLLEAGFQTQVVGWLRYYGWTRIYHAPHGAHGGGKAGARVMHGGQLPEGRGFPDLIALKGPRLLVAELKTDRVTKLGPGQPEWIAAWTVFAQAVAGAVEVMDGAEVVPFAGNPEVDVRVWRPRDTPEIVQVLGRGSDLPSPLGYWPTPPW